MYKVNLELGKINKYMKLKFGIVINSEQSNLQLLSKFSMNGNTYFRINPYPMVTIEISSNTDRGEGWNSNRSVTLNKMTRFQFVNRLRTIIKSFKEIKSLFYYQNDKLCIDKDIANSIRDMVKVSQKTCLFMPSVIEDEETKEQFEGVVFMINSPDNYCYLTFEELEYLCDTLNRIDFDAITLQLINLISNYNNKIEEETIKSTNRIETQQVENEDTSIPIQPLPVENTIPEI